MVGLTQRLNTRWPKDNIARYFLFHVFVLPFDPVTVADPLPAVYSTDPLLPLEPVTLVVPETVLVFGE